MYNLSEALLSAPVLHSLEEGLRLHDSGARADNGPSFLPRPRLRGLRYYGLLLILPVQTLVSMRALLGMRTLQG